MAKVAFDFSGTTTIVTGGASGIGLAIAETLVRSGGDVVISASRNPGKTEAALQRLRAAGPAAQVLALACEVGREESVAGFFAEAGRSARNIRLACPKRKTVLTRFCQLTFSHSQGQKSPCRDARSTVN